MGAFRFMCRLYCTTLYLLPYKYYLHTVVYIYTLQYSLHSTPGYPGTTRVLYLYFNTGTVASNLAKPRLQDSKTQ